MELKVKLPQSWNDFLSQVIENNKLPDEYYQTDCEINSLKLIYETIDIRNLCYKWIETQQINKNYDVEKAANLRTEGNKYFQCMEYWEAAKLYTKVICRTSSESLGLQEAALAHANRASALMQMGFFEVAMHDCRCALDLGLPEKLLTNLYLRLANCSAQICNQENLEFAICELKNMQTSNKLDHDEIKEFLLYEKQLQRIKTEIETQQTYKENSLRNKQKILSSSDKGRYVVATEDIQENEIIMKENAFAFIPVLTNQSTIDDDQSFHCQMCANENIIPFPCTQCHLVYYCSAQCRITHFEEIHQYECDGYKRKLFHNIGIAYLAVRVFIKGFPSLYNDLLINEFINDSIKPLSTSLNTEINFENSIWKKINELIQTKSENNEMRRSNTSTSSDNHLPLNLSSYYDVLSLCNNMNKMNRHDLLQYRLTGIMLAYYLRFYTTFFTNYNFNLIERMDENDMKLIVNDTKTLNDCELVTSALITKHICQMICNAHTIDGLSLPFYNIPNIWISDLNLKPGMLHWYSSTSSSTSKHIFAAIYPKVSLYNHSCESNFRNRFIQNQLICVAKCHIRNGEEILNSYGENYKLSNTVRRKWRLRQQYFFECKCQHCSINDEDDGGHNASTLLSGGGDNGDYYFNEFNTLICGNKNCKRGFVPILCKHHDGAVYSGDDNSTLYPSFDITIDNYHPTIKCPNCNMEFQWNWYNEFIENIRELRQIASMMKTKKAPNNNIVKTKIQINKIYQKLFDAFTENSIQFVCENHVIRQQMATLILDVTLKGSDEQNDPAAITQMMDDTIFHQLFFKIVVFALERNKKQYSPYALEYIQVSTYFLDLLAVNKRRFTKDEFMLLIHNHLHSIFISSESLMMKTKCIFARYFENYIMMYM